MSSVNPTSDLPPPILPRSSQSSPHSRDARTSNFSDIINAFDFTSEPETTRNERSSVKQLRERNLTNCRTLFEQEELRPKPPSSPSAKPMPHLVGNPAALSTSLLLEPEILDDALPPTPSKKCNWLKVASIIIGVIGLLFTVFGALCAANVFSGALLGGKLGAGCAVAGGAVVMGTGAMLFYHNYRQKQVVDLPPST